MHLGEKKIHNSVRLRVILSQFSIRLKDGCKCFKWQTCLARCTQQWGKTKCLREVNWITSWHITQESKVFYLHYERCVKKVHLFYLFNSLFEQKKPTNTLSTVHDTLVERLFVFSVKTTHFISKLNSFFFFLLSTSESWTLMYHWIIYLDCSSGLILLSFLLSKCFIGFENTFSFLPSLSSLQGTAHDPLHPFKDRKSGGLCWLPVLILF